MNTFYLKSLYIIELYCMLNNYYIMVLSKLNKFHNILDKINFRSHHTSLDCINICFYLINLLYYYKSMSNIIYNFNLFLMNNLNNCNGRVDKLVQLHYNIYHNILECISISFELKFFFNQ